MNQRTRSFLIGSAAVVLLGLGTGLVAYYNGGLPNQDERRTLSSSTLPASAAAVGYADVRSIMASEFRQKIREVLPTGEEKDKIQAEFGVDIENDIDTVSAAYLGGGTPKSLVVIVRGRFQHRPDRSESHRARRRGRGIQGQEDAGVLGVILRQHRHPSLQRWRGLP